MRREANRADERGKTAVMRTGAAATAALLLRTVWLAAMLLLSGAQAGATPATAQASPAAPAAADSAAIKEVVRLYVAAREANDAKAVAALFTPDADQLVSTGEWRKGRDALVRGAMASSQRSGGRRTITVETIRLVAPGVALADGPYEIAASPGNEARRMWASFVMTKEAGGWQIAAIRNMLPAPPPPAPAGGR